MNAYIRLAAVLVGSTVFGLNVVEAQDVSTDAAPALKASADSSARLSYGAGQVLKMWQAGVDTDVIGTYIKNANNPYHLDADGTIYLKSVGLPPDLTQSMMQRDVQLQQAAAATAPTVGVSQPATMVAVAAPVSYAAAPQPVAWSCVTPPPPQGPTVVVIGSDPPPPSVDVTLIGSRYPATAYFPSRYCDFGVTVIGSRYAGGCYSRGWCR